MSATGLAVFDETVQKANTWLSEISQILGSDRRRAYQALPQDIRAFWPLAQARQQSAL